MSESQLHVVSAGSDRVANKMPMLPWGTGCEARECAEHLEARILYSPSGAYISFVENWGIPTVRVWTAEGKTILSMDAGGPRTDYKSKPTMSVWSGNSLYWRDDKGVQMWRDGVSALVLPGVTWIRPKASPTGGQIVYWTRDTTGTAYVHLLDTRSNSTRELGKSRSEPAFLTSRYLWYQEERPCVSGDPYPCGGSGTTITTGKTYIYDLQTGSETESIITYVWDVWPHPA
jgi:hypothetical protein